MLKLSSTEEKRLKEFFHKNGYRRSKFNDNKYLSNCPLHPDMDFPDYKLLKFSLDTENHFTALRCRRCQAEGKPWENNQLVTRIIKGDM